MLKEKTLKRLASFLIEETHKQKEVGLIDKMWRLIDISSGIYCGSNLIKNNIIFASVFVEDVIKALNDCTFNSKKEKNEATKIIKELNSELEEK